MIELRVPPAFDYAPLVAHVTDDAAARAGLDEERRTQLAQAARTGFELIVRDAMTGAPEPIHVHASWTPAEMRIALRERGLPLDETRAERSDGWHEIVALVDRAQWKLHGRSGSELQLTVTRPHGISHDGKAPRSFEENVEPAPEQAYTVRRFEPSDAAGVARAFYQTWGYHYIFPAVYVPQRLTELNAQNAYISIVAEGENGEIVGHYALDPVPGTPIADGCAAVVVPAHRGRGLLERLRRAAEDEAVRLGFAAYYSEPVTTHARTQTDSIKFGAQLCAIVLGGDPKSFVPKAMQFTGAGQRQSYTVFFKALAPREARPIYAPPEHCAIVEQTYVNLGVPVHLREADAASGDTDLHISVSRSEGYASIDILKAGASSVEHLTQAVADVRALRHLGALYINIPLEDPAAPALCEAAQAMGFFYCGVIPWWLGGRDALRLQLPLTPIDLSQVTIAGDFGARLKAYIADQMNLHS
jgi:GNAT superfamily N-acetyltransferase